MREQVRLVFYSAPWICFFTPKGTEEKAGSSAAPHLFDLINVKDERIKLAFFAAMGNIVVAKDKDKGTSLQFRISSKFSCTSTVVSVLFQAAAISVMLQVFAVRLKLFMVFNFIYLNLFGFLFFTLIRILTETMTVNEACRRMADRKVDALFLTDSNSVLSGILTDKDIGTKVVARELDLKTTLVSVVMTRNPVFVVSDTLAVEALQKMVQGLQ
ncbi:hypothetical protein QVD17_00090 [Tagetes erecta]|uniref:CBS domain-containing protein n=1 Tax=Tagetes erecta TaxID=13708 RepID=A0AAD8L7Z2_TARER|nr:hypothetical protein QVD17_00090 [Tagetes erecta]